MSGFGEWLRDTQIHLAEINTLRTAATQLGNAWPLTSTTRADFETAINNGLQPAQQPAVMMALQAIWPIYEAFQAQALAINQQHENILQSLINRAAGNLPAAAVVIAALIILYLFLITFTGLTLEQLARTETARGILTFIFGDDNCRDCDNRCFSRVSGRW